MTAFPHDTLLNIEEYFHYIQNHLDARYEYIDGHITMLAGGTLNHATIAFNMAKTLDILLHGKSCRVYTSDAQVRLSEKRYVYPDVTVTCDARDQGSSETIQYPRLIVEVLSPGTAAYDRGEKFEYYREVLSIQEYVLVDSQRPSIELFRREKQNLWSYQAFKLDDTVELIRLGVHFNVSAVYQHVSFLGNKNDDNSPA